MAAVIEILAEREISIGQQCWPSDLTGKSSEKELRVDTGMAVAITAGRPAWQDKGTKTNSQLV